MRPSPHFEKGTPFKDSNCLFSIVVAQQMFFSVLTFLCVFIYDVLFVNVRVSTIWQMIRASVTSFITGAPVVKIIKLHHHFFPLKS